jgi:hypothetical protein
MARRASVEKKKKPTVRIGKSEAYIVNRKYLGDEPLLKESYTQSQYLRALSWYNYMCNASDAREYFETYLQSQNRISELKMIKRVSDSSLPYTAAWIARMYNKGYPLDPSCKVFLEKTIKKIVDSKEEIKTETHTNVISIQQRMKEKVSDIIAEIEEIVDNRKDTPNFSLYDWLKGKSVPASYSSSIVQRYAAWHAELLEAREGKDKQLKEAYSNLSKKQIDADILFFKMLIEDAERYGSNTKKVRAPRKPRTVSVEKKLKNLKFQKEDNTFKIASVNPEKLIGCQELWTFNTKYKTLTVFRALDRGGLQVKGTSIIGYDEKISVTKRTGRKTEHYLNKVLNGGKIVLRKLMDEIESEIALSHRINENTILLKIV